MLSFDAVQGEIGGVRRASPTTFQQKSAETCVGSGQFMIFRFLSLLV
ncbi:uncharacterized protein BCN122_III0537 [Burkholderia cenocepacia]|nr:uncharacterized protein BCN122_III0537 [Burkholderia cenocepacia]